MRRLILGALVCVYWNAIAVAADPRVCQTHWLCAQGTECVSRKAEKFSDSDFADKLDDTIAWRSEVYQLNRRGEAPSFCYFRTIRLENPSAEALPLHWEPGGIAYKGGPGNGCVSICEEGVQALPSKTGLSGLFLSKMKPVSVRSRSWGPAEGYGKVVLRNLENLTPRRPTAPSLKTVPPGDDDGQAPAQEPPVERRRMVVMALDGPGREVRIEFSSHNEDGRFVRYTVRNVGKVSATVWLTVPSKDRWVGPEGGVIFKELVLEPGAGTENKSAWLDGGTRVIEQSSVIKVRAAGREADFDGIDLGVEREGAS